MRYRVATGTRYKMAAYKRPEGVRPYVEYPLFYSGPLMVAYIDIVFAPSREVRKQFITALGLIVDDMRASAGAGVEVFDSPNSHIILVTYDYDYEKGASDVLNIYAAHEAVHITSAVHKIIGDKEPSEEATAVMCGYFGGWLIAEANALCRKYAEARVS